MQFVLGPYVPEAYAAWQHVEVDSNHHLMAHPSLNVDRVDGDGLSVVLLGYILDPGKPDAGNSDILKQLLSGLSQGDDLFDAFEPLGGRWALIVKNAHGLRLFHDAVGLRQVFHTDIQQTKAVWCASQPDHIGKSIGLEIDIAASEFISGLQERDPEYWWPGTSSHYRQVKRLLPNHYLDLETGSVQRFWPRKPLKPRSLDETVDAVSRTLSGLVRSAAHRFDLTFAMSAGWDSRLTLAASRSVAQDVRYYTVRRADMDRRHMDVNIPTRLLKKLGLHHDLIEHGSFVSPEFKTLFNNNVSYAHPMRLAPLQSEYNYYKRSKVAVTGNISEVARCYYRSPETAGKPPGVDDLVKLANMDHPFSREAFKNWLDDLGDPLGYDVLDLFYWEQRSGSWFAQNCLEFDAAWQELFFPFNNRRFLMDMLAVDNQARQAPDYVLYKKLISRLWPEVLAEPINPLSLHQRLNRLSRRMIRITRRLMRLRS